ncbi:MAG: glycosyl hydrolase 53 family protein [Bacteroidales bacterium]|nr:glycosyl hydrolase 53 family protein [Bacteroidales bacterium]
MKRLNIIILAVMLMLAVLPSCGDSDSKSEPQNNEPQVIPLEDDNNNKPDDGNTPDDQNGNNTADLPFAYGADAGWLTEMESKGVKFYDNNGKETECFALLKSIGFNAARMRVWVQPTNKNGYGPWCDKADVVAKAKRAAALGYKVMIDFHYSDNWADPGQQRKPEAWDNFTTIDQIATAAYDHTKDVLQAVKDAGVDVAWVQIGNETTGGMLKTQSDKSATNLNCDLSNNADNYIKVHNTARKAVKEVFPDCKIIVHFDRGQLWDKFSWGLDKLVKGGAEFDIFGLSIYPDLTDANWYKNYVDALITNLNKVATTYDKDVMVCEVGCANIASYNSRRAINDIVVRAKKEVSRCKGVFYWEPECYGSWNGYAMGAFLSSGKPSEALNAFNEKTTELLPATDPNAATTKEENLYIYTKEGELLAECTPDDNGVWRGKITTTSDYLNFTVFDGKGTKYAVKDWNTWNSFVKATATFDHFWFGGDIYKAGTYDVWFDPAKGTWGGSKSSK